MSSMQTHVIHSNGKIGTVAFDALVAGAGIWGSTVARRLAEAGKRVLVIEKRSHVGGNVRCHTDSATGIEIHLYGSHIFHTHIPEAWRFINRFTSFNGYQHKVIARYRGKNYFLPLGLPLINKFFGIELTPNEVAPFMADARNASAIFDAFFRGYTSKQWGRPPEDIDPSIIRRVPVRSNYDINYFNDYHQGIPSDGYNAMFDRILDHPNIAVETETSLQLVSGSLYARRSETSTKPPLDIEQNPLRCPVYYSGPIDALFHCELGHLPWRTLRFETETLAMQDFQGTSVVNHTEAEVPYTRIHEFKHYHPEGKANGTWGFDAPQTIITREYSSAWQPGDEPYYPIDSQESRSLLEEYRKRARAIPNLTIGGRLGEYKYYDMDRAMKAALNITA